MAWTRFMDMHSGGRSKTVYEYVYIEASKDEAYRVFYSRFDSDPDNVTCDCCGNDFSVYEHETLEQATAYNRNCDWRKKEGWVEEPRYEHSPVQSLDDYVLKHDVLIIRKEEITDDERTTKIRRTYTSYHEQDW